MNYFGVVVVSILCLKHWTTQVTLPTKINPIAAHGRICQRVILRQVPSLAHCEMDQEDMLGASILMRIQWNFVNQSLASFADVRPLA
jgi:hypothetical protein